MYDTNKLFSDFSLYKNAPNHRNGAGNYKTAFTFTKLKNGVIYQSFLDVPFLI